VAQALRDRRAVVALESTIIAHGMPYPQNVDTAGRVEAAVRETGAVPAAIAILNGRLKAGLTGEEIDFLGKEGPNIAKVSRRDLPRIVAEGRHGATTVASTMIIAAMAGIPVFATGGIGGVHRGATQSMDISADLQELARTNVAVVTAGAKAILDLALTLEYLETFGVPVIGYRTDEFPAFYTRKSGLRVDARYETPADIAQMLRTKWDLGLDGGVVIANPIPEQYQMPPEVIEEAVQRALKEADRQGIKGKNITPFLLARIEQLTEGKSLFSNIQLALNNARLAGAIAAALADHP
jgi:pseudouridine-5'-phosphate glycosidase